MNEPHNSLPEDIRVNVVMPKQSNYKVMAVSDPVTVQDIIDNDYEQRIQKHVDLLNNQSAVLGRDKNSLASKMQDLMTKKEVMEYNGQRVNRLFNSLSNSRQQESFNLFQSFSAKKGNFMAFDIETFGDSQDRINAYGISEISMNEYDANGNLVKKRFNGLLRQQQDVVEDLQQTLNKISSDKYHYNTLPDYKKRSIVDLMRYSMYSDEHDEHAFSKTKGIQHHSIIRSVFNFQDKVDHNKVINQMGHYLPYMQSGLETLSREGQDPKEAMQTVSSIMKKNADKFLVSYNGNNFDMPVMSAYASKLGISLPKNTLHLDQLAVTRMAFSDSDELKARAYEDIRKQITGLGGQDIGPFTPSDYSKDKLAAFRPLLDAQQVLDDMKGKKRKGVGGQSSAHNATADTNDTAKIVALLRDHTQAEITKNNQPLQAGFTHHATHMTWNEDPMYHGQQLFANGGVMAYQSGDESYRVGLDEEGKWVQKSNGFNKTVLNSKTFYQFAGHQQLEDTRQAFRFYDPERNEYSYIVRKGEHAFQELQDFVQKRFYNWDNVTGEMKRDIKHVADTDRARRRYDRYFSMDGGGKGLSVENGSVVERGTKGFSGLKRMLENAQVMQDHLQSNGKIYRDRVKQYRSEGMTESQAKKKARKVSTSELNNALKFDSQWNPETKKYVFNVNERDSFFKMYERLIDEMPNLNQAIQAIDHEFASDIQSASKETNNTVRKDRLREVNQKRDRALMKYHQMLPDAISNPTTKRELASFESKRLSYFDPEVNGYRSLNFETVQSVQSGIYSYARRGVEEDNPNRRRVIRERANNLIENLSSQNAIIKGQKEHYQSILFKTDSPWNAAQEIATHMRGQNGLQFESHLEEPSMVGNKAFKEMSKSVNADFVNRSIQDTRNAMLSIKMNAVEGDKLVLGEEMRKTFDILDAKRFSGLHANDYQALEDLVTIMRKADPTKHIAIASDPTANDGNLKIYAYDGKHSAAVQNQLESGRVPSQALEVNLPLVNQSGTHKVGAMVMNAHSLAVREGKDISLISSSQHIARGYKNDMYRMMKLMNEGHTEEANKLANRSLREQIRNMSGIQRNMQHGGENDTYQWANNQSDELKQSHIKLGNALVEDYFYNGYNNMKLTEADFYDPDDVFKTDSNNNRVFKRTVGLQDVNMETQHKLLMNMNAWAEDKLKMPVFTSSIKAEQVSSGTVSSVDMRQVVPFGSFYNHGRDNMVQYMNSYLVNTETDENLKGLKGVSRNRLLETERHYESGRGNTGINMKTAYMTNDQLSQRMKELHQSDSGSKLLRELDLLEANGDLKQFALPRLYEQQGMIAHDVYDALGVDNEKRYAKGKQFQLANNLHANGTINPGQLLGIKTHDNGTIERVFYEGTHKAKLIQGLKDGEDLLLQWKSKPFKVMLDGEKMTDSPVHRKLIQALTGQDDIAAIINPDVEKHKDFGMLMSGESRLLAEHVNNISDQNARQKAIGVIEKGNIGLKWKDKDGLFIDDSFDKDIHRDSFDQVFKQLGISNTTETGYRVGVLEAHLSKVSNYSKVIDHTGKRVIGENADGDKIYGGRDGVQWGHREMGVLKSQGLDKTREHVYQIMKENGMESTRLQESRSVAESLRYMTQDERVNVEAISASEFGSLPEQFRNEHTYKGTIFDQEEVKSIVSRMSTQHGVDSPMNQHGFWMKLPSVERDDQKLDKITVNVNGDPLKPKAIDKIFIPFTNVEGANGDVHLRNIQKQIASIYEKAKAVDQAGSRVDAQAAHVQLQTAVNGYVKQSFSELSSSKGMLFGDAFKTSMGGKTNDIKTSSASGLFKLMDFETSERFGDKFGKGQYTVISEQMAKDMGVFDQLDNGKELYTANVRYPTFHDGAMQFTKLRMDASIKTGEIHTTSFSSMLQNADSDGDYSHIVVMDNDDIQKEWKGQHDATEQKFQDRWDEHRSKADATHPDYKPAKPVSLAGTSPDEMITKVRGNTDAEMASKIGKMTIGRASNLNLFLRQIADQHYSDDKVSNYNIKRLGEGLEQKLIDAKHGAEPVGLKMIDHIYGGEWDKAMDLDDNFFGEKDAEGRTIKGSGMFQTKYKMAEVAIEMPIALQKTRNGLKTPGMKFGTSMGINSNIGVQNLIDLMYGGANAKDFGGDNNALGMFHKYLGEEGMSVDRFGHTKSTITPLNQVEMTKRDKGRLVRNMASDAIGGSISDLGSKIGNSFEAIKGMSGKTQAIMAGGLAVAGIAGYNILNTEKPVMHYNNEESPSSQEQSSRQEPTPALQTGLGGASNSQNASINIQASGTGSNKEQMSQAVVEGMRQTDMRSGPTRVSVNHQDNTQQLNRQWYRDKVRENI